MSKPVVAIVGRPNVGKSTFFNYIVGQRISIVEDTPGVTRDRVYAEANWRGVDFTLIDTAGIEPESEDIIISQMREQANIAINIADVIVFLTDIKQGVTAADEEIALMLKKSGKPVILVCNKVDNFGEPPADIYEFYNLGIGNPYPVSSTNALGIGDVLDAIYEKFPKEKMEKDEEEIIKVAIIGKPNVGKSSLVNRILGENRAIVSNIAGTTRDAIDSEFENELSEQDTKVIGEAHEAGKGLIIAVNKWDEVEKETGTLEKFKKDLENKLGFASYAPIIFISAKTGQRVNKLFEMINNVASQNAFRVSTSVLNEVINQAIAVVQPPTDKGRRLRIYYGTQATTKPPTFVIFVNNKELFHFSYQRYIINCIRNNFGLEGTPVRLIIRERGEKED